MEEPHSTPPLQATRLSYRAREQALARYERYNRKSLVLAYILLLTFGWLAGHRFYLGQKWRAFIFMALTCGPILIHEVLFYEPDRRQWAQDFPGILFWPLLIFPGLDFIRLPFIKAEQDERVAHRLRMELRLYDDEDFE